MKFTTLIGICSLVAVTTGIFVPEKEEADLETTVKSMEKELESLKATVKSIELANLRHSQSLQNHALQNFTGFTAYATATRDFNSGDTVIFDGIKYNHGNAYNSQTSTFTCQVTGYYYFDLHIYESNGREFGASISLSSVAQTKVYISADLGDNLKGSTSVVVYCQVNQQVQIECQDEGELEGNLNAETSFSGFLVGNI